MNETTTKIIAAGLIGMIIGFAGTSIVTKRMNNTFSDHMDEMRDKGDHMMHGGSGMKGEMEGMMMSLEGKTGTEFDKIFLKEMIIHHEGAVEMAEAALENAERQEIKDLSIAIIEAQNKEIEDMKKWAREWYE